jgi:F-type H+-transporting ATPase subunit a
MDAIYDLIKSILKSTTSLKRNEHFAVLFYLFIFLLYSNLIGLVPFSFTFTSTFSFTLILAFGYFIGINLIGF